MIEIWLIWRRYGLNMVIGQMQKHCPFWGENAASVLYNSLPLKRLFRDMVIMVTVMMREFVTLTTRFRALELFPEIRKGQNMNE